MKRLFGMALCLLLFLSACAPKAAPEPTTALTATVRIHTPTQMPSATSTATITLTNTPESTETPAPTETTLPTPTHLPLEHFDYSTQTIRLTTEDDIVLAGNFFLSEKGGDTAVLMNHMGGDYDQQSWIPVAEKAAESGFTALTFDFRCCGQSECSTSAESGYVLTIRDMRAAIDFLHQQGFQRIVCMGASMGGRGCITMAFQEEFAGLVILAGTRSLAPDSQNLWEIINPEMPKLFILAAKDPTKNVISEMNLLYEGVLEPKTFKTMPGSAHGTELFNTQYANDLSETIFYFLQDIQNNTP